MREVSITADPTVSDDHPAKADDPQASLRAGLLDQIASAQSTLEAALAEVANADPAIRDRLRNQISLVAGLRQQVGTAQGGALAAFRAEVASIADNATAAAQDARTNAAADASSTATIGTLARNARDETTSVMAGMKDFDRDLKFSSAADQAAYREREAERQAYIAAEQAKHTSQGDLNASGAAVGQMADAAAHGAAQDPAFQSRFDKLAQSTQALRDQLVRDGKDVSQFDAHLRDDLRTIMRAKGIPDSQIDALLAAHQGNPLEAVQAFVAQQKGVIGEKEIDDLTRKVREDKDSAENGQATVASPAPSSPLVDAMAKLKASGVVMASDMPEQPTHGITAQIATVPAPARSL